MELLASSAIQYKILQMVEKKVVLPMFIDNIANISTKIYSLKNSSSEMSKEIKNELNDTDLEHTIIVIGNFLNEISENAYKSTAIHINLCGIYDVLHEINEELYKINEEIEYTKTSWYHYTLGWMYFKSQLNVDNIKRLVKLLNSRYKMLLNMMMVHKITEKNMPDDQIETTE